MSIEAAEDSARTPGGMSPLVAASPSIGFIRQAVHATLASHTARAGLVWLALLLVFAAFGPFIANTCPLAIKTGGHWSSPLMSSLDFADWLILLTFFETAILLWIRRTSFAQNALLVCVTLALAAFPAYKLFPSHPSQDYTRFRLLEARGKVEGIVHVLIPYSPSDRLFDQPNGRLQPPGRLHFLGTDSNSADLASNLIHASRIALSIGFMSTGISVVLGVVVGGIMGYYTGLLDLLGMRAIEIFEALPRLPLLITVTAFVQQRNIYLMMAVIGLTGWTSYARFLRGEFLVLRKADFVQAAIAAGLPRRSILFRHMLPNGIAPILVSTTFSVASAILFESILSFLGLGLVDQPSWGSLLNQARAGGVGFVVWLAVFPGLAIFLTVFSYNLVGEAVRDALDPKLQSRA
jgi:peptide/nickel transport system permease protein